MQMRQGVLDGTHLSLSGRAEAPLLRTNWACWWERNNAA